METHVQRCLRQKLAVCPERNDAGPAGCTDLVPAANRGCRDVALNLILLFGGHERGKRIPDEQCTIGFSDGDGSEPAREYQQRYVRIEVRQPGSDRERAMHRAGRETVYRIGGEPEDRRRFGYSPARLGDLGYAIVRHFEP